MTMMITADLQDGQGARTRNRSLFGRSPQTGPARDERPTEPVRGSHQGVCGQREDLGSALPVVMSGKGEGLLASKREAGIAKRMND